MLPRVWMSRRRCGLKKCAFITLALLGLGATYLLHVLVNVHCSTETTARQIQDLCTLYNEGVVAGDLCPKLCEEERFFISNCGGNSGGKKVAIMHCLDCKNEDVVWKTKLDIKIWTRDNGIVLNANEETHIMVNRTREFLIHKFRTEFKKDLSRHEDVLSYIWGKNVNEFVKSGSCSEEEACQRNRTLATLQSILALSGQEEYLSMVFMNTSSYIPKLLQGTCGPSYLTEYTPSIVYLGYVLYQGKIPEVLSRPKVIPWRERARVAIEIVDVLIHLESQEPPVFMCDTNAHNFGLDSRGHVVILDVDSLEYGRVVPEDRVCYSDKDCKYITCRGKCDLRTNKCSRYPVNNHLQVACRNILLSFIPEFGLLRGPPAVIADRLHQMLMECSFPGPVPDSLAQTAWRSNDTLRRELESLLQKRLSYSTVDSV